MAREYNDVIHKVVPAYEEMQAAVVNSLPYQTEDHFRVLDLGCGTGNLSIRIRQCFPNANIVCMDIADDMLSIARQRLSGDPKIEFIQADMHQLKEEVACDAVVSGLVLHHVRSDDKKRKLYEDIYRYLNAPGVLIVGDIILGETSHIQNINKAHWIKHMSQTISREDIESKWIPRHEETDRPCTLTNELKWILSAGFRSTFVTWKEYSVAVYGGIK